MQLTVSIVLYNNDLSVLDRTVRSVLESPIVAKLYLIDNSPIPLEENIISAPLHPIALESISSVMEEQSHPHPYSFKILIRNGFGVAFTAKYSRKPLFHANASLTAFAFSRIPFSSYK